MRIRETNHLLLFKIILTINPTKSKERIAKSNKSQNFNQMKINPLTNLPSIMLKKINKIFTIFR
jgi:hypothetical protein